MLVEKIINLKINEFENLLNNENYIYIKERYNYIWLALERYQEGARLSNQDEYLEVNEYFDLIKES